MPGCVNDDRYGFFLAPPGNIGTKISLQQWLTTRQRDTTTGGLVKNQVFKNVIQIVLSCLSDAAQVQGVGRADLYAITTASALIPQEDMFAIAQAMRAEGTGLDTLSATGAALLIKKEYGLLRDGLRIMAPVTMQAATLEKNCRADPRPVTG